MASTSAFGWETPDDTDLVKDGAAAIRTLGNSIDTSMADLKGGTSGQVLSKASNTDMDFTWTTIALSFAGVKLGNTATQSIANNTSTAITWSTESFDTDSFHSTVTNTSRITIPAGKAGYYSVGGFIQLDNNATGDRALTIKLNGATVAEMQGTPTTAYPTLAINSVFNLTVGDYVELFVFQNSGGSRSFYTNGNLGQFYATYLGA